jgi:hypothetical protein
MRITFFSKTIFVLIFWICVHGLTGQTVVVLHMDQLLGGQSFAYGQTTEAEPGYFFNVSRLQYYVSEITMVHDGGQRTLAEDLHLLIDPAKDSVFVLGTFDINDLEQIEFWIGVDSAHNHLDPSTYPENHPLAHHDPSMHWGWAGGYRFIVMEGVAGYTPGFLSGGYQIHTIGDENYRKISLAIDEHFISDTMIIPLEAEYSKLLRRVQIAGGWESHSSVGKSKQLIFNTQFVFSPVLLSNTTETSTTSGISISPNPAREFFTIAVPWENAGPLRIYLSTPDGRPAMEEELYTAGQYINIDPSLPPGLYFISVTDGLHPFISGKIIVQD